MLNKIIRRIAGYVKDNRYFLMILIVGIALRVINVNGFFYYGHDHDLSSWFVKDVVVEKHLRLIGQETSTHGVFIGPLYYYLLVPFYMLFSMSPLGGVAMVTLIAVFGIFSCYHIFKNVFSKQVSQIATLIYSTSFYMVFNDREVVPTMPVMIWTLWFFYSVNLYLKKETKKAFIIWGVLIALIWNLNFALILTIPLILLTILLSQKKINFKHAFLGVIISAIGSIPLLLFELRHNFIQVRAILTSLTTDQKDIIHGIDKIKRVIYLASKNIYNLFSGEFLDVKYEYLFFGIVLLFIIYALKKWIDKKTSIIIGSWIILYLIFFSLYSKVVSEYYLNGIIVPFIVIVSLIIDKLLDSKIFSKFAILILIVFSVSNIYKFTNVNLEKSSYFYKKQIVSQIKSDAEAHGFSCIAISYIVDPGYDLGWRYLFYLENMHVNRPSSGSPVYTIIYPLKPIFKEDVAYGSIGLIYPDYLRYTSQDVVESCSGENSNLTDPMFGFTN